MLTAPPMLTAPLTVTVDSNLTASPKVLLVRVSVVDVPTIVAVLTGSVIVRLPL